MSALNGGRLHTSRGRNDIVMVVPEGMEELYDALGVMKDHQRDMLRRLVGEDGFLEISEEEAEGMTLLSKQANYAVKLQLVEEREIACKMLEDRSVQ